MGVLPRLLSIILLSGLATLAVHGADPVPENRAAFLTDEVAVGRARWGALARENEEVFSMYFLWDGNRVGGAALAAHAEAAERGARVRIIVEGLSSFDIGTLPKFLQPAAEAFMPPTRVSPAIMLALKNRGVEIRIFNAIDPRNIRSLVPLRVNTRAHEKLSYFKGQRLAALGDRNWQGINFGLARKKSLVPTQSKVLGIIPRTVTPSPNRVYRSAEGFVQGPAAADVGAHLEDYWNDATLVSEPDLSKVTPDELATADRKLRRLGNVFKGKPIPQDVTELMQPLAGRVEFIRSVPAGVRKLDGPETRLFAIIRNAKKNITIASPYLTLTPRMKREVFAAMDRGVEVTFLSGAAHALDAEQAGHTFALQARQIIARGGKIHLHQGPELMHAKLIAVDVGTPQAVGGVLTHNFDAMSEYLNYESGLLFHDPDYVRQISDFQNLMITQESRPFTMPKMTVIQRCIARSLLFITDHVTRLRPR